MSQEKKFYISIILAIILLVCLFHMPYGFYTLVRFVAMAAFAYLAFLEYQSDNQDRMIVLIILAVLFQPFLKITLRRVIWNIVDVAVAGYLLYLCKKQLFFQQFSEVLVSADFGN